MDVTLKTAQRAFNKLQKHTK